MNNLFLPQILLYLFLAGFSFPRISLFDQALAQTYSNEERELLDSNIYRSLLRDLGDEAKDFSYLVNSGDIEKFRAQLDQFLQSRGAVSLSLEGGKPWSDAWPPKGLPNALKRTDPSELTEISYSWLNEREPHSLKDKNGYLISRLGRSMLEAIKQGQIEVTVWAGSKESCASDPLHPRQELISIPSIYEKWGINKYIDLASLRGQGRPRVVFVIPPIKEYANHYSAMLKIAGAKDAAVYLNEKDRAQYRKLLHNAIDELWAEVPFSPDHVSMGYGSKWASAINNMDLSAWRLDTDIKEIKTNLGVNAKLITITHKQNSSLRTSILTIESDLTLWGEASAFLVEGIAKHHPGTFTFFGSAGAPNELGNVYDVSVPKSFILNGRKLPQENYLSKLADNFSSPFKDQRVLFDANHGNTNSPAEQTQAFVGKFIRENIQTIDVEQCLVADVIAKENQASPDSPILFGAANLITDKPSSDFVSWLAENSLDKVDPRLKEQARLTILSLALRSFDQLGSWDMSSACTPLAQDLRSYLEN